MKPWPGNARTHSQRQIEKLKSSIRHVGFPVPIVVDENTTILSGHGRLEAAWQFGLTHVPCVRVAELTEAQKRAYVLADNRIAEDAGWDRELLNLAIDDLVDLTSHDPNFDIAVTGFDVAELDALAPSGEEAE